MATAVCTGDGRGAAGGRAHGFGWGTHGVPSSDRRRSATCLGASNPDDQDADQEGQGAPALDNSMERTRFFRRPVVWIILVIIGAIALSSFFTSGPSYQRVDTSVALERLSQPGITKAVVKDKEQTLQLDLAAPEKFAGKTTDKIETQYPYEVTTQVWSSVQQAKTAGRVTQTYNATVSG